MAKRMEKKTEKKSKRDRITEAISAGTAFVTIKQTLNPLPHNPDVPNRLLTSRVPGASGRIVGFDTNLGGTYYFIEVQRTRALYHIDDFTI